MNLNALVDAAINETPELAPLRPVVEKELLHYEILRALDEAAVLDKLVFQGGTNLRLCHGAPRYSEDLDFAGATPGVAARDTSRQGFCCTDDPILTPALIQRTIAERDFLDYLVSANQGLLERAREAAES